MKSIKYIIFAAVCTLFTACQDKDWGVPDNPQPSYGNSSIKEKDVLTIQELKDRYKQSASEEGYYTLITEDIQIKGYVTGNDRMGNLYKEFTIQDETGAVTIGVNFGGVFGFLPEGQEILVSLKDLYIGNYRQATTIGMKYTDNSNTICVGRMPVATLSNHFTYTKNKKSKAELEAMVQLFADGSSTTEWDIEKDAGKLGIIKNVSIKKGGYYNSDTKGYVDDIKFEPGVSKLVIYDDKDSSKSYSSSWYFNEQPDGQNGGVQLYTSSYADFAANLLPSGKMNITGIIKRYRGQWEIIIRDYEDIQVVE